jgi:transcriptional regulator with PAS, ATPase and Fis domain
VLITGESGVGKDLLARHIHGHSPRGDNAFVAVNCAAFSESLLLSELFGHEKGAFTGAESRKLGCFERAHGGTLFLDEIGDMALDTQAKLLRVLESREFERLGGSHGVRVDVRVIAATNHDLGRLVRDGRFREDLYYRINVVRVHVPPLRERHDDIKLLVETFLEHFNRKYQRNVREIPPSAMEGLLSHPWPGNIRELKNVISQSVLLSSTGTLELFGLEPKVSWEAEPASSFHAEVTQVTAARERELVESALRQSRGNKSEAARMLGITRKTLQRKVARFELDAEEYREYLVTQRVGHQVSS